MDMWSGKPSEEVTLELGPRLSRAQPAALGEGNLWQRDKQGQSQGWGVTSMASTVWEQQGSPSSHRGISAEARGGEKLRSYQEAVTQCLAGHLSWEDSELGSPGPTSAVLRPWL